MARLKINKTCINAPYGRLCDIRTDNENNCLYDFFFYLTKKDNDILRTTYNKNIEVEFPCCSYEGELIHFESTYLENFGEFSYRVSFTIKIII